MPGPLDDDDVDIEDDRLDGQLAIRMGRLDLSPN